MTRSESSIGEPPEGLSRAPSIERFSSRMRSMDAQEAPVIWLAGRRRPQKPQEFPFASLSVFTVLMSLLTLSLYLGGWTWSSWTYALSLGIGVPLVAVEIKRKAVITGGAVLLLALTVIVAAGLPQYFGYSSSDLSWYDLAAHYLGAMFATVFLWSVICWTADPSGPSERSGSRALLFSVVVILIVSLTFEFAELATDALFGWGNFHPGVDTYGDIIFDIAGIFTAAVVISRHRTSVFKRPFWNEPSPDS